MSIAGKNAFPARLIQTAGRLHGCMGTVVPAVFLRIFPSRSPLPYWTSCLENFLYATQRPTPAHTKGIVYDSMVEKGIQF